MPKPTARKARKPERQRPPRKGVFGQGGKAPAHPPRVALYARVSAAHQQTIPMQLRQLREYAKRRGWQVVATVHEVGAGAERRPERERLLEAARRRELDVIAVWRLDRWGRSLADLVLTLRELAEIGVAFVSLTEALDLTTPTGRAMAAMIAVFAEFEREVRSERVRAGIEQARREGRTLGRPKTAALRAAEVRKLAANGLSQVAIARELGIGRTSVRRFLNQQPPSRSR
ncbi:MAG: recombinase family protein [Sandaracinaceae bacterium]|nr:recombinase family protein [Sandaracinaceae bacterium]